MILLLIRHADAGERDPARYPDDTERPITRRGRKAMARVCRVLRRRDFMPDLIFSSPWTRAWQTSEIVADELTAGEVEPVELPALTDSPHLDPIADAIGDRGSDEIVALVGHDPWISELGSLLLTSSPERLVIDFPKGGVLGLDLARVEAGGAELRFLLRPKMA